MPMVYRTGLPRYLQIADALRSRFHGAAGPGGGRIPSEHALCAEFRVSRPTVRQALDLLVEEGLLSRQPGRGTFTSPVHLLPRNLRVIGSVEDMIALGDETRFKLLDRAIVRTPVAVAQALRLQPVERVARITGVRHTDGAPFQHATVYLPERLGAALLDEDLTKTSVIGAVERTLGLTVKYLEQVVEAAVAPRAVAESLGVPRRTPLLHFTRTYFTEGGEPVEHALTYNVGQRYPYKVVLLRSGRRG
jgi:GntR family transcriptional regulator